MRFIMPQYTSQQELYELVRNQIKLFLKSKPLEDVLKILNTDIDNIKSDYDARARQDGGVKEAQLIRGDNSLEELRYELYPLFDELGFYSINKPVANSYNRLIVLGGTLNACNNRVLCAKNFVNETVTRIDALTAFRPINPIEKAQSIYTSHSDTEFGVMSDAFINHFELSGATYTDDFTSNRNLNEVACVRHFNNIYNNAALNIYASPSLQPDVRRADTGDCVIDYINNNTFTEEDRLLFISHNRYCNRQFLQILTYMLKTSVVVPFDIIGYVDDNNKDTADNYNLSYDLQEMVAIVDWMKKGL